MNWEKLCPYFKFNLNKIKKNIAFQTYCNELDIPFPQFLIIYQQIGKKYFSIGKNEILSPKKILRNLQNFLLQLRPWQDRSKYNFSAINKKPKSINEKENVIHKNLKTAELVYSEEKKKKYRRPPNTAEGRHKQ